MMTENELNKRKRTNSCGEKRPVFVSGRPNLAAQLANRTGPGRDPETASGMCTKLLGMPAAR